MTNAEWVIAGATLLGPVLAVQAQKWIERVREGRARKESVFQTLMATRMYRLTMEHVRALNMIEFAWGGARLFGQPRPNKKERAVIAAWRIYLDHLNSLTAGATAETTAAWERKLLDLLVDLLAAMAFDLDYSFDAIQLKKGAYAPRAHATEQSENQMIRQMFLQFLNQVGSAIGQTSTAQASRRANAVEPQLGALPGTNQESR